MVPCIKWKRLSAERNHFREGGNQGFVLGLLHLRHLCSNARKVVGHTSLQFMGGFGASELEPERTLDTEQQKQDNSLDSRIKQNKIAPEFSFRKQACLRVKLRKGFEGRAITLCNKLQISSKLGGGHAIHLKSLILPLVLPTLCVASEKSLHQFQPQSPCL